MTEPILLPDKIKDAIKDLNDFFWYHWNDIISTFPDTLDGDGFSLTVCRSAIISIFINYIIGFDDKNRKPELENMIHELRNLEVYLRDYK